MNIERIIQPKIMPPAEGIKAKLLHVLWSESHLRASMINEGNTHIKKAPFGALSLKDSFSKATKELPLDEMNFKKVTQALDNVLDNKELQKQLDIILEILNVGNLKKGIKFGNIQQALETIPKPNIEYLFSQNIIPEKELKDLARLITENNNPKETLTLLHKAFLKNFNLEEFRNTFAKLLNEQIKKIK